MFAADIEAKYACYKENEKAADTFHSIFDIEVTSDKPDRYTGEAINCDEKRDSGAAPPGKGSRFTREGHNSMW